MTVYDGFFSGSKYQIMLTFKTFLNFFVLKLDIILELDATKYIIKRVIILWCKVTFFERLRDDKKCYVNKISFHVSKLLLEMSFFKGYMWICGNSYLTRHIGFNIDTFS